MINNVVCNAILYFSVLRLLRTGYATPDGFMKAAVLPAFGQPNVLEIRDVQIPTVARYQLLVHVKVAGINTVDGYMRAGTSYVKPSLPAILGKEISGLVQQVHPTVSEFEDGDRVFCGVEYGGYAEYAVANESDCYKLDDRLTFSQGASIYVTYFTVFRGLVPRGHVQSGDAVLVNGASGVLGVAAIQVAKALGAEVVATVGSETDEELMKENGVDAVIYHNCDNYMEAALRAVGKSGFDTILEILPNFNIEYDKKHLIPYGRIVVMGNRISVMKAGRGVYSVSFFKYPTEEQKAAANFVMDAIERGLVSPLVSQEYKLDEVVKAHTHISYFNTAKLKLVLIM